jgi:hypothetical protein
MAENKNKDYIMKNLIAKLVLGLFALTLLCSPRQVMAQSTGAGDSSQIGGGLGTGDFKDAANESTGLTSTLRSVANILYVFYLWRDFYGRAAIGLRTAIWRPWGKPRWRGLSVPCAKNHRSHHGLGGAATSRRMYRESPRTGAFYCRKLRRLRLQPLM